MKISLINPIGYCKGVVNAINTLYDVKKTYPNKTIYLMGQLVHNDYTNQKLLEDNVKIITSDKEEFINSINEGIVVFSAHGISKKILNKAKEKGLITIDTTCPYVKKSMDLVKGYINNGYEVIYISTKKHPETEAMCSISKDIHVVESIKDIDNLTLESKKVFVTNKTTLSIYDIREMFDYILLKYPYAIISDEVCNSSRLRQQQIMNIDSDVDTIIVVGDKHSNNATNLFKLACESKKQAFMVSNINEFDISVLSSASHVALVSAASTPIELVKEIEKEIKNRFF